VCCSKAQLEKGICTVAVELLGRGATLKFGGSLIHFATTASVSSKLPALLSVVVKKAIEPKSRGGSVRFSHARHLSFAGLQRTHSVADCGLWLLGADVGARVYVIHIFCTGMGAPATTQHGIRRPSAHYLLQFLMSICCCYCKCRSQGSIASYCGSIPALEKV
jgi:hypothetical protein